MEVVVLLHVVCCSNIGRCCNSATLRAFTGPLVRPWLVIQPGV